MGIYRDITKKELELILEVLKNPNIQYSANSISRKLGISSMGALKIIKKLEKESILKTERVGKSKIISLNKTELAKKYVEFALKVETEYSKSYIKRWISELKKIKNAEVIILFGSVLFKFEKANDIDVLVIIENNKFEMVKNEINELNKINLKQIHPIYQTEEDFIKNLEKRDKVLLNAIKGVLVYGEDKLFDLIVK